MKKVDDSYTMQTYIVRPQYINGYGRLFGGQLMQWIDELAGIVCRKHSGMIVTTAAIDNLIFKKAAYQNDMVTLTGKLTYVGKTSMEVRVDTFVEDQNGKKLINEAYVVMVAIDEDGTPRQVPGLELRSEEEKTDWKSGKKRYDLRKQRNIEGY